MDVSVDGVRLHLVDSATSGRPVLLLHGAAGCDLTFMQPLHDHLAGRHRVISVDLRGHGRSTAVDGRHGSTWFALDAAALIDQLSLHKPVVIGHSSGGNAALELAATHSGLLGGIGLLDAGPLAWAQAERPGLEGLIAALRGEGGQSMMASMADDLFRPDEQVADAEHYRACVRGAAPEVFADVVASDLGWDGRSVASRVKVPTLAVGADTPYLDLEEIRELIPHAVVGRTAGSGHFHQLVVPDQVNAMVSRFLELVG
ncbi:MAG: hypothetical protein QOJ92_2099 [Frankiales bacterium]|nr:hypothetical protein [Frankiales bacterium]